MRIIVEKTVMAGIAYGRCAGLKVSIDGSKYKKVLETSRVTFTVVDNPVMLNVVIKFIRFADTKISFE